MKVAKMPRPKARKGDTATYSSSEWRLLVLAHDPEGLAEFHHILARKRANGMLTESDRERLLSLAGLESSYVRRIVLQQLRGYGRLSRYAKAADRLSWPKMADRALAAWNESRPGRRAQAVRDAVYDAVAHSKAPSPSNREPTATGASPVNPLQKAPDRLPSKEVT